MKRIAILGSTGSIGKSTLSIVESFPDRFSVVSLAAGNNVELAFEQARRWRPQTPVDGDRRRRLASSRQAQEGGAGQCHRGGARIGWHRSESRPIPTPILWSALSSEWPGWRQRTKPSRRARPSDWRIKNAWSRRAISLRPKPVGKASRFFPSTANTTRYTSACAAEAEAKFIASG